MGKLFIPYESLINIKYSLNERDIRDFLLSRAIRSIESHIFLPLLDVFINVETQIWL